MDGHGFGEAANDDGSGAALVMELARVFSAPDVQTDRSIRFVLWNNEETGLNGAARLRRRSARTLQGKEDPAGSGRYPEPRWLGMIQHDMMMFDHGMPGAGRQGRRRAAPRSRRQHRVRRRRRSSPPSAEKLAWFFRPANDKYATDYPAAVGDRMSNTDSDAFKDLVPVDLAARERAPARRSAPAGTRSGTSRPTSMRPTATTTSASASTRRRPRLAAVAALSGVTVGH